MADYDFEPREAPSIYLKLKSKGDKVLVRILSSPYREPKVWKLDVKPPLSPEQTLKLTEDQWMAMYRDPDYNITESFHWKVLDRETGLAKIFSGTAGIFKQIKKFAQTDGWGDPTQYDIAIERTEQPGINYYTVTPMPDKSSITDKEKQAAEAIDMAEKLPAARLTSEKQVDYVPDLDESSQADSGYQSAKAQAEKLKSAGEPEKEVEIEDLGGEPVNLDDIPF